jgi:hypothetical protein
MQLKSPISRLAGTKSSKQSMRVHQAVPARVLHPGVFQIADEKHRGEDRGEEFAGEWG